MTRLLPGILAVFALTAAVGARAPAGTSAAGAVSDSLYTALHPRLLFSRAERPALQSKVRDGGRDDEAYAYVHVLVDSLYPASTLSELMDQTFGMRFLLDTGLVSHLDDPPDDAARNLGRTLTLAVADSFAADDNTFYSPVRLRILCWGYDMCMDTATAAERGYVRDEIESYIDSMMTAFNYERWLHSPYTSNLTAMIGASLGIASMCLSDEMEPARVQAALARADTFVAVWKRTLAADGSCREGVQYGAWAFNHLVPYFVARKRFDGFDYGNDPAIRGAESWFAFEMLPEPGSVVNNLNDTAYRNYPLTRHGTYLAWAMTEWSSGVAAWLWERTMGTWGHDWGINQDRAATILWWRPLAPANPGDALPRARLWRERGLYYYRTGWPQGGASDDAVFSFYSGRFFGGHTQQDQNSFTIYAYGNRFAADNGFDTVNWASEAHNMIFVDGVGQHYAGTTYGTDGDMAEHVLGGYADYLMGDATAAYTTHSHFNDPGVPFPDDDWSAGYQHPNPVQYAQRRFIVVHQGAAPPYFVLLDDIRKDDGVHLYEWRMHTELTHTLDANPVAVRLTAPSGAALAMDVLASDAGAPAMHEETYTNPSADPDTRVVVLSRTATAGRFGLVMRPLGPGEAEPVRTPVSAPWGGAETLDWPSGTRDVIIANPGLDTATVDTPLHVSTDARMAHIRMRNGAVSRAVLVDATTCRAGGTALLQTCGQTVTVIVDGGAVRVSSADACLRVYAPDATAVFVDDAPVPFTRSGDYVIRGAGTPARTPAQLGVNVYPSPFSGNVTIAIDAPGVAGGEARVYDVSGRAVRHLWSGTLVGGRTLVTWDGRDDAGRAVASGVYFMRATSSGHSVVHKIVRVR